MPIKPPNQSSKVYEKNTVGPRGFSGKRLRDYKKDYRQYNEDPTTYKGNRETASPKSDRQPIYDTRGFKDALDKVQREFGSRINPDKKY